MSYEYLMKIHKNDADAFMQILLQSKMSKNRGDGMLELDDKDSCKSWSYDVRIFRQKDDEIFVELTSWSENLFKLFFNALNGVAYKIADFDDESEITLKQMFRRSA